MAVSVSITTPILDGVNQGLDLLIGKLNLLFAKLWKIRSADRPNLLRFTSQAF